MQQANVIYIFVFKSETLLGLVLGGIQTYNLQIFGETPKPSCLGAWQEDSFLHDYSLITEINKVAFLDGLAQIWSDMKTCILFQVKILAWWAFLNIAFTIHQGNMEHFIDRDCITP